MNPHSSPNLTYEGCAGSHLHPPPAPRNGIPSALQSGKVAHFREDFTMDSTDFTDEAPVIRINSLSVKSVKSVVQFFLVAAGRAGHSCGKSRAMTLQKPLPNRGVSRQICHAPPQV
jgi:hypothetical protein